MTNEQFDAYTANQLQLIEIALKEIKETGTSETLEKMAENMRNQLTKP